MALGQQTGSGCFTMMGNITGYSPGTVCIIRRLAIDTHRPTDPRGLVVAFMTRSMKGLTFAHKETLHKAGRLLQHNNNLQQPALSKCRSIRCAQSTLRHPHHARYQSTAMSPHSSSSSSGFNFGFPASSASSTAPPMSRSSSSAPAMSRSSSAGPPMSRSAAFRYSTVRNTTQSVLAAQTAFIGEQQRVIDKLAAQLTRMDAIVQRQRATITALQRSVAVNVHTPDTPSRPTEWDHYPTPSPPPEDDDDTASYTTITDAYDRAYTSPPPHSSSSSSSSDSYKTLAAAHYPRPLFARPDSLSSLDSIAACHTPLPPDLETLTRIHERAMSCGLPSPPKRPAHRDVLQAAAALRLRTSVAQLKMPEAPETPRKPVLPLLQMPPKSPLRALRRGGSAGSAGSGSAGSGGSAGGVWGFGRDGEYVRASPISTPVSAVTGGGRQWEVAMPTGRGFCEVPALI
ncbi:hypothetical protein EDC01DRAFT_633999 [Geopyxis carbonaria]|nr:hypothetical protein EDC01DRAFT_633999 [Geopyxis carbonaria]